MVLIIHQHVRGIKPTLGRLLQDPAPRTVVAHGGEEHDRLAQPGQVFGDIPAHPAHTDPDGARS